MTHVTLATPPSLRHHAEVARIDELKIIERRVRHPIDFVVRELVDPGQGQPVEVRVVIANLVLFVTDFRWRRHVTFIGPLAVRVSAVTLRA